jgi:hypothetical protein
MQDVAQRVSQLASVAPAGEPDAPQAEVEPESHAPEVNIKVKKPLRLRTFNTGA